MNHRLLLPLAGCGVALLISAGAARVTLAQGAARGTIKGHVRVMGPPPGNAVIRLGMDPMCARIIAGKLIVQEVVAATADGSLANVFARVQGTFPQTPP